MVERSDQLRISINTGRAELIQRLNQRDTTVDGLEWSELRERAASGNEKQSREAQRILHRRLALSVCAAGVFVPWRRPWSADTTRRTEHRSVAVTGCDDRLLPNLTTWRIAVAGRHVSPFVGAWLASAFMILLSMFFLIANRRRLISIDLLGRRTQRSAKSDKSAVAAPHCRHWHVGFS